MSAGGPEHVIKPEWARWVDYQLRAIGGLRKEGAPEWMTTAEWSDMPLPSRLGEVVETLWDNYVIQLTVFYMVSQPVLKWVFKDGRFYTSVKPMWKAVMASYNLAMSLFSMVCFVLATAVVVRKGVFSLHGSDIMAGSCLGVATDSLLRQVGWLFYVSKYIEYIDTWFLIIAQKPVSTLQYFHHAGAPVDMFLLWYYFNEGMWIFVVFNGFIHTIMYFYFACAVLGIKTRLKVALTTAQILQLVFGNTMGVYYAFYPCFSANPYLMISGLFNVWYVYSLTYLFLKFFYDTYMAGPKKAAAAKAKGKAKGKAKAE